MIRNFQNALIRLWVCAIMVISLQSHALSEVWFPGGAEDPKAFNASWHPTDYRYQFNELPLSGSVENEHIPWADSYWPIQRGGMGYRWKQFQNENETSLTAEERKRLFFDVHHYSKQELLDLSPSERSRLIATLSPLEKYSIYIGDYDYSLVSHFQKPNDASISYWQGFCHAWAPMSLHFPEPMPVNRTNADGIEVPFGSADVKAMMIASYAERVKVSVGNFFGGLGRRIGNMVKKVSGGKPEDKDAVFVGQRCAKRFIYPTTKFKNGREVFTEYGETEGMTDQYYLNSLDQFQSKAIRLNYHPEGGPSPLSPEFKNEVAANMDDPSCRDVNAGAFHIIIANQLGRMKEGFLFDKTRDVEVWNQPAFRFESSVVEWQNPNPRSSPGTKRVVHLKTRLYYADDTDYGWAFWFPTLPNLFSPDTDLMAEYQRYQKLLMNQGDITEPGTYPEGIIDYSDYEYTIDLDSRERIIGGEWISFDRPDFLWLFKKLPFTGEYKKLNEIYEPVMLPSFAPEVKF